MLTLTRFEGGKLFIGPDIVITVVEVSRGKVKLGVVAPKSVKVWRDELLPHNPAVRAEMLGGHAPDLGGEG